MSISGRNPEGGYHEVALLDLLPAGFEIETVLTEEKAKPFGFLPKLTETRIAEGRDDRVLDLLAEDVARLAIGG